MSYIHVPIKRFEAGSQYLHMKISSDKAIEVTIFANSDEQLLSQCNLGRIV